MKLIFFSKVTHTYPQKPTSNSYPTQQNPYPCDGSGFWLGWVWVWLLVPMGYPGQYPSLLSCLQCAGRHGDTRGSQSSGSIYTPHVAFHSDHRRVPWSHLCRYESEQWKDVPSLACLANILGIIFRMVATTILHTVTSVTSAEASWRCSRHFVMASTMSG